MPPPCSRLPALAPLLLPPAGHEAYVVGGTVRDLLLGGTPKDFDLLTSAEPHQVSDLRAWRVWRLGLGGHQPRAGQTQAGGGVQGTQPLAPHLATCLPCLLHTTPSCAPCSLSHLPPTSIHPPASIYIHLCQVKALFPRCIVVGRSFPVCQVYAEGTMIEVGGCEAWP